MAIHSYTLLAATGAQIKRIGCCTFLKADIVMFETPDFKYTDSCTG